MRLPKNTRLLDVSPPSVDLTLAQIVKRELTIKPQLVGRLPNNLEISTLTVKPEKLGALLSAIQAKGQVSNLTTTPIYLETIRETTTLFCKIIAPPAIHPIGRRWPDVEVTVEVKSKK